MHPPVPGNVYDSDLSPMGPSDPFYISLLARASSRSLWPDTTVHPLPGHLTPGASFADYHRPNPANLLGIYDTADDCDFNNSYQSFHEDWSTQRTWHTQTDQLAGRPSPVVTSADFKLDSAREDIIPLFDTPNLPPFSIDFDDPRIESPNLLMANFDPCDSLMQEFAASQHTPWHALNPLEPGFDMSSMLPSLRKGHSDYTHKCEWRVDGSPCNAYFLSGDNLKYSVSQHFSRAHNLLPADGKSTQKCLWLGCAKELKQESIVRHILTVHLRIKTTCKTCGTSFARQDSLQRHVKNSCGAGKRVR